MLWDCKWSLIRSFPNKWLKIVWIWFRNIFVVTELVRTKIKTNNVNIVLPINTVTVIGIYCFYCYYNIIETIITFLLLWSNISKTIYCYRYWFYFYRQCRSLIRCFQPGLRKQLTQINILNFPNEMLNCFKKNLC